MSQPNLNALCTSKSQPFPPSNNEKLSAADLVKRRNAMIMAEKARRRIEAQRAKAAKDQAQREKLALAQSEMIIRQREIDRALACDRTERARAERARKERAQAKTACHRVEEPARRPAEVWLNILNQILEADSRHFRKCCDGNPDFLAAWVGIPHEAFAATEKYSHIFKAVETKFHDLLGEARAKEAEHTKRLKQIWKAELRSLPLGQQEKIVREGIVSRRSELASNRALERELTKIDEVETAQS